MKIKGIVTKIGSLPYFKGGFVGAHKPLVKGNAHTEHTRGYGTYDYTGPDMGYKSWDERQDALKKTNYHERQATPKKTSEERIEELESQLAHMSDLNKRNNERITEIEETIYYILESKEDNLKTMFYLLYGAAFVVTCNEFGKSWYGEKTLLGSLHSDMSDYSTTLVNGEIMEPDSALYLG